MMALCCGIEGRGPLAEEFRRLKKPFSMPLPIWLPSLDRLLLEVNWPWPMNGMKVCMDRRELSPLEPDLSVSRLEWLEARFL